ncbi:SDR family oxidoreductase [Phycicoccus sonneratiae]|uniref:NmrA family NAD(P)-binding protein n=1 Tax=Phycicoccus sonneratiae TaxID=2807628 RepID=A0ABS2CN56_9MICO|nr:NmrA family NAD(P)-binding protein [Phycicoccus sonneraticus]MBM6400601.1 NmrA family NAD(P)-binding protein [Phycicoccus sonneraticus]
MHPTHQPDVLVLGGTGLMGREVLAALRRRGAGARVLVRDPARLAGTEGLDVRVGDLRDPEDLRSALVGIRVVFHISPHEDDEVALSTAVVRACEAAGVRIVFAGVAVGGNPLLAWVLRRYYGHVLPRYRGKIAISRMVQTSATRPVVLAVSNFMQNDEVLLDVIRDGKLVHPCHPKGLNRVDLRDLGEIAATVLLDPDFPSGTYPVVGPRSVTGPECAAAWAAALHRPVRYVGDDDAALERALRAHLTGHRLEDWLSSLRLIRGFAVPTSAKDLATTERLLGRPATPFAQFAERVAREHHLVEGGAPAARPSEATGSAPARGRGGVRVGPSDR